MKALARYAESNVGIRSMRSTLVSTADFETLARASSPGAAWNFVRKTAFGTLLPDVDWKDLHTAEQYIRHASALQFRRSIRRLQGRPATVATLLLSRWDLDNLQIALRTWHGRDSEQSSGAPIACYAHRIPLDNIVSAQSLVEIIAALEGTPYATPIAAALSEHEKSHSMFAIELSLEKDFYARLIDATTELGGADARDGLAMLGAEIDLLNLAWIARILRAPQAALVELPHVLIPGSSKLSKSLKACGTSRDRFAQVSNDYVRRVVPLHDDTASEMQRLTLLENAVAEAVEALARRQFERFPFRVASVYAFYLLVRLEMKNLIAIFAGKAIGMSESEILKRLYAMR